MLGHEEGCWDLMTCHREIIGLPYQKKLGWYCLSVQLDQIRQTKESFAVELALVDAISVI